MASKKRKVEAEALDVERSMYSSFVAAANAVSQLYTQGMQQQRRAATAASKATLEKTVAFVLRENEGSEHISKAVLLQFLQHEYENADSLDVAAPQPQFMPFPNSAAAAAAAAGGGGCAGEAPDAHKAQQHYSGMLVSPAARSASAARLACLEEQQQREQQAHMQQQQAHMQQQLQQHFQQQQHQQQQQQGPPQHSMMHMGGPFAGHHNGGFAPPGSDGMH